MKRTVIALILCLVLLAGCAQTAPSSSSLSGAAQSGNSTGSSESKNFNGRELDVLFMVGGQGKMADPILAKLEEVYPGLKTNVVYDHNAGDILRSRVMAGDAPDIFDVNAGKYDYYSAISEGVMQPLDFLYKVPCVDDPKKTLGDILQFSMMSFGCVNGKYYCMSDSIYTSGLWYDANMFKAKGYTVPGTWDEFVALGEKAKADGKHLICYSSRYGGEYFFNYFFNPLVCSIDVNAFGKIQNLAKDAYSDPAAVEALNRVKLLVDKGYADTVSGTLEITETQMQFCNGNVLFYPCGSWLEAEMAGNWPDGFKLTYAPFPANKANDPSFLAVTGVVSGVSATTKNLDIVTEYYRYMLSNKETTSKVVETTLNGLAIADFSTNYGPLLSSSVASSWDQISKGKCIGVRELASSFYPDMSELITGAIASLDSGKITVAQYIERMNEFNKTKQNDSTVIKRSYDMTALMQEIKNYKAK